MRKAWKVKYRWLGLPGMITITTGEATKANQLRFLLMQRQSKLLEPLLHV